jgi:hypothetical protein
MCIVSTAFHASTFLFTTAALHVSVACMPGAMSIVTVVDRSRWTVLHCVALLLCCTVFMRVSFHNCVRAIQLHCLRGVRAIQLHCLRGVCARVLSAMVLCQSSL